MINRVKITMKIVYRYTAQAASSQACCLEPLKTARLGQGTGKAKKLKKWRRYSRYISNSFVVDYSDTLCILTIQKFGACILLIVLINKPSQELQLL